MFGQTALGSTTSLSDAASRMFRFEVKGLRQTYQSDKLSYPIRRSGSAFISVPYNRMNEEMQRISRLGGKIVSIQPLNVDINANSSAKSQATAAHQNVDNGSEDRPKAKRKASVESKSKG